MNIEQLREQIKKIDEELIAKLNERAKVAREIKETKAKAGRPFYDPVQFSQVKERLHSLNRGPLSNAAIDNIYHEIHSAMLNIETNLKVVFVADKPESYEAAHSEFGSSVELIARKGVDEVLEAVKKGEADYGVVPLNGDSERVLDDIAQRGLKMIQGIQVRVKKNGESKVLSYAVVN